MATIRPLHNHFIFQFEEDKTKHLGVSQFQEKTDWGFEFAVTRDGMETGRWVNVLYVGPECKILKPGMRVCVDKLKWTTEVEFEGEPVWKSDEDNVLLIDENVQV